MANIITKGNIKISICFPLIIIVPIMITITSSSIMLITFTFCHLYPSDLHLVLPSSQLSKKIKGKKWIVNMGKLLGKSFCCLSQFIQFALMGEK